MLNFLFGDTSDYEIRLRDYPEDGPGAAPIIKLCSAIVHQAASDRATQIRFSCDPARGELQTPPTREEYEAELERQRRLAELSEGSKQFRRIMAEASIRERPESDLPRLCVDFQINEEWGEAMTIPTNLKDPVIRRYPFYLNYQNCVSLEIPENLIYVNGYYCSISRYTPKDTTLLEVTLEPDPDL
jgi:hypothetical protein